jgi:hypothetical protein
MRPSRSGAVGTPSLWAAISSTRGSWRRHSPSIRPRRRCRSGGAASRTVRATFGAASTRRTCSRRCPGGFVSLATCAGAPLPTKRRRQGARSWVARPSGRSASWARWCGGAAVHRRARLRGARSPGGDSARTTRGARGSREPGRPQLPWDQLGPRRPGPRALPALLGRVLGPPLRRSNVPRLSGGVAAAENPSSGLPCPRWGRSPGGVAASCH